MSVMTPPSSGTSHSKRLFAALGVVADMAAVAALLDQGIQPVLVVAVAVAIFVGIAGLVTSKARVKALGAGLLVVGLAGAGFLATPLIQPPSTDDAGGGRSAEGWYDLTAYKPVSFGNGHYSVNSISIGGTSYPNSIRGSYTSSAADPNNRRTWLTDKKCTRLSVWVGKDAASSQPDGTGRFLVKSEDIEIASAEATVTDDAKHVDVDITGVLRLTLLDTRNGKDANNAWGNPRVFCTAAPGQGR